MPSIENLVGTEIQGWLLVEILGRGADGIVYAGTAGNHHAAVKLFFPECLAKTGLAAARERLDLQLSLSGPKPHPNLVQIYAGGYDAALETLFLVMELVQGTSLDKLLGRIPPSAVVRLAGQLASAAQYLESKELVHRDIKPANIMVSADFQTLTLLDFGILCRLEPNEDQSRLSGTEFVATLRYSPPEFVWRTEQADVGGAWRAVTFYQIGATLHDMIMGQLLFAGHDAPRARLYDSVRDHTPNVHSNHVPGWLLQIVKACLLKNWRQRLQFVSWDGFFEAKSGVDTRLQEHRIRIRQIRNAERRQVAAQHNPVSPSLTREQQLWELNNLLVLEIRNYLLNASIFPRCRFSEQASSTREYTTHLSFDSDETRDFVGSVIFTITVGIDPQLEEATKLSFIAEANGVSISAAAWTEMFTVETAFAMCRQSFLDAIESMAAAQ